MAIRITSASYFGISGKIISIEVDISRGLPAFNMVGLADISVKESKERVRSSILNSGYEFPVCRITINLAPADLKKEGSLFDLPIAIGILLATGQIHCNNITDYLFIGELSLSGEIKKIRGALPVALEAKQRGINNIIIPLDNYIECEIVNELNIYPFYSLNEIIDFLEKGILPLIEKKNERLYINNNKLDFNEVYGQLSAKRAFEVAAAGFHNLIIYGPPGSGKTMLASRLPSILPDLSYEEALEVTKIYSISGNLEEDIGMVHERPFRNPHHTTTKIALVGGGNKLLPGEITLAHNGVLFLDEIMEFNKNVIEVLRQPLEDKCINISRAMGKIHYPSNFMLIGATNPCCCGNFGSNKQCTCSDFDRKRYLKKLSAAFLDRIDLFSSVRCIPFEDMYTVKENTSSKEIKIRVEKARDIQKERFVNESINFNSQMNSIHLRKYCTLNKSSKKIIEKVYDRYDLSTRAYSRIVKVARTIADLKAKNTIDEDDILEALNYRKYMDETII